MKGFYQPVEYFGAYTCLRHECDRLKAADVVQKERIRSLHEKLDHFEQMHVQIGLKEGQFKCLRDKIETLTIENERLKNIDRQFVESSMFLDNHIARLNSDLQQTRIERDRFKDEKEKQAYKLHRLEEQLQSKEIRTHEYRSNRISTKNDRFNITDEHKLKKEEDEARKNSIAIKDQSVEIDRLKHELERTKQELDKTKRRYEQTENTLKTQVNEIKKECSLLQIKEKQTYSIGKEREQELKEKVQLLEAELNEKHSKLKVVLQAQPLLQETCNDLKMENEIMKTEVKYLTVKLEKNEEQIKKETLLLQRTKSQEDANKSVQIKLNREIERLKSGVDTYKQIKETEEKRYIDLHKELQRQSAQLENERENGFQQSMTLKTLEKKYAALEAKGKDLESKAKGLEEQLKLNYSEANRHEDQMSRDLNNVMAERDDLKNNLANAEQRVSEYRQKEVLFSESQRGREEEINRLKHELGKTKGELDDTKQRYRKGENAHQTHLKGLEKEISSLQVKAEQSYLLGKERELELGKKIQFLESEINEKQSTLNEVKKQCYDMKRENEIMNNEIKILTAKLEKNEEQLKVDISEHQSKKSREYANTIDQIKFNQEIERLSSDVDTYKQMIEKEKKRYSDLEAQFQMQSTKLQNERENCNQQSRTLETLEKKYAGQVAKSKDLESQAKGFEEQLKLNNSEAKRHEKQMSVDLNNVMAERDDLKNKLANAEQRVSEYRQKEVAFNKSQPVREKEIDRLKHEHEKTKRNVDTYKQMIETEKKRYSDLEAQFQMQSKKNQNEIENCNQQSRTLETLEQKYAAQVAKSKDLELKTKGLSEDLKKVTAERDDLKNKLANAEQRVSEYRQKEVAVSESQPGREKEIDKLKHELENTKRELDDTKHKYGETVFVFLRIFNLQIVLNSNVFVFI